MGAKVIRSPRNSKGKSPGGYYSVGFASQLMIPASPVHGHFVSPFIESPKHTQRSDVSCNYPSVGVALIGYCSLFVC